MTLRVMRLGIFEILHTVTMLETNICSLLQSSCSKFIISRSYDLKIQILICFRSISYMVSEITPTPQYQELFICNFQIYNICKTKIIFPNYVKCVGFFMYITICQNNFIETLSKWNNQDSKSIIKKIRFNFSPTGVTGQERLHFASHAKIFSPKDRNNTLWRICL